MYKVTLNPGFMRLARIPNVGKFERGKSKNVVLSGTLARQLQKSRSWTVEEIQAQPAERSEAAKPKATPKKGAKK